MARRDASTRIATLILILLSSASCAQVPSPALEKGNWDFSAWVAGASGEETTNSLTQSQIFAAGVFCGKVISGEISRGWLRNSMEYGFDLIPVFVTSNNQNVHGVAFDPVIFRWNSSFHTAHLAPYIEGAGGGLVTSANLPPGNTSTFNVTARGGGGVYVSVRNRRSLDVGVQWLHASNANLGPFNPQFNGVQIRLGYHWYK
ncbi:MAG: acyloxyacyl hydrolase [Terriglobales bacterium]